VPQPHRYKKQRRRTIPAALAQPSSDEGCGHKAHKIPACRTHERRKTADGARKHRQSDYPFRQIGHDSRDAEAPAVDGADHKHDQRLQRHRNVGQRQIDLGRQRQQCRSQRDQDHGPQHAGKAVGASGPQQRGERKMAGVDRCRN
jgi:hypothetical protein